MKVDLLDPVIEAAPGQTAVCRVRVHNDTSGPAAYRLRIVGLSDQEIEYPLGLDALPAGTAASFDVAVDVPRTFAAGRHSLAMEVVSDRRGDRSALADVTVDVAAIHRVALRINPGNIIGRLRGRFDVEIDNREARPIDIDLHGDGTDLDVSLAQTRLRLIPGDTVAVAGSVTGKRRLFGDSTHHLMTISAISRSAPVYAEATFEQRSLIPRRFRSGMAILALLGLWAGLLIAGTYWYTHRDDDNKQDTNAALAPVDLDGDGKPDAPLGSLPTDTSTGANGETGGAEGGGTGAGGDAGTEQKVEKATATSVGGTVKAGESGEDTGILVTLAPAKLGTGEATEAQAAARARGGDVNLGDRPDSFKIWSALSNRYTPAGVSEIRMTESVRSTESDTAGLWAFSDVLIRDNYEVAFSKPGYDTKAVIVTPPEDGTAVELEVTLDPASGAVSGTVTGPNGPLGGVDIVITDGTLTFTTATSSDAGKVGTYAVTGLSTPNTYTLTATLRGYGTEVLQLPMDAGAKRTGINVSMRAGVGSIGGHVTSGAAPLGGVTITASLGDKAVTTTSLTLGDAGAYNLPQLIVPGTYTVSASAPGYLTQSRSVVLAGNAPDINFSLVRTTAAIIGQVVSNANGPLSGVGITVGHDDLSFTSSTAIAPSAGSFRLDELPPGDYLVTFERYDHETVSQLVIVVAGQVLDLGTIQMTFRSQPRLTETGSVAVAVRNSSGQDLTGATIQLLDISDGSVVRELSDQGVNAQASFLFQNVPIGTYTVRAARNSYRTSTQRVSVGLSQQSLSFMLLRLGQANGRVLDAVTGLQLRNYQITIWRIGANGARETPAVETIPIPSSFPPNADGDFLWESTPNSLIDGTYEIDVRPPPGYAVKPQILDPDLPSNPMRFVVSPTDEDALRLNDILLDPYPNLTGKIYTPVISGPGNTLGLAPLDANATVALTCPGVTASAPAVMTDTGAPVGIDTYTIDRITISSANLVGNCQLTVQATGFLTAVIPLPSPLAISSGGVSSDQTVNIALVRSADEISGITYYRDYGMAGNPIIPVTADVRSISGAISNYSPGTGTGNPTAVSTPPPIVAAVSGNAWAFTGDPRQIFGTTTYQVSHPDFDQGTFNVSINQSGRTVGTGTNVDVTASAGTGISLEMQPRPGSATGQVNIVTTRTPDYAAVAGGLSIVGDGPGSATRNPTINTATGAISETGLAAGTWRFDYTNTSTHYLNAPTAPASVSAFVPPNGPSTQPLDTTVVELGRLAVDVVDDNTGVRITGVTPTVTLTDLTTNTTTTIPYTSADGWLLPDVPVNLNDPLSARLYTVAVSMPGYDTEVVNTVIDSFPIPNRNGQAIELTYRAGRSVVLQIRLKAFGTLTGTIDGLLGNDLVNSPREDIPFSSITPTVTRVLTSFGQVPPVGSATPTIVADPADPGNGFVISGPPGYYTVSFASTDFPTLLQSPTFTTANTYLLTNGVGASLSPSFVYGIATGRLNLGAYTAAGFPVIGAVATVTFDPPTPPPSFPPQPVQTQLLSPTGSFDLFPGTYFIDVRRTTNIAGLDYDDYFPAIIRFAVPRGGGQSTIIVTLGEIAAPVQTHVGAVNAEGDPVAMPASVTVNRTFVSAIASSLFGGGQIPNEADEGDYNPATPTPTQFFVNRDAANPTVPQLLAMAGIPAGVHRFSFSAVTGYTPPADQQASVQGSFTVIPDPINYVANNVTVRVQMNSNGTTPASPITTTPTVTLVGPDVADSPLPAVDLGGGLYEFNVTPETAPYRLSVTNDPFHADLTNSAIQVDPSGTTLLVARTLNVDATVISGTATRDDDESGSSTLTGLSSPATVQLEFDSGGGTWVDRGTVTPVNGAYSFTINAAGNYRVTARQTSYATRTRLVTGVALGGTSTGNDVTILRTARITVAVNPPAAAAEATFSQSVTPNAGVTTNCSTSGGPPPTAASCVYTGLDPDVAYSWSFASNTAFYSPTTAAITAAALLINGDQALTATFGTRNVSITVTTDGSSGDANSAAVVIRIPAGGTAVQPTSKSGNVFTFNALNVGAGEVVVSRTDYRTRTIAFAATSGSPQPPTAVTIYPLVDVSGRIQDKNGGNEGGATVNLMQGATVVATTTSSNAGGNRGRFTFSNVDSGTYTVSAVKDGVGIASYTPITIDGTNPAANTLSLGDIQLQPRDVPFTFNVSVDGTPPTAATNAAVIWNPGPSQQTGNTGAGGAPVVFTFKEDALPAGTTAFQVTKAGYITVNDTFGTPAGNNRAVTLYPAASVSGTVTNATSNAAVQVLVCTTTPCTAATVGVQTFTVNGTGGFTITGLNQSITYQVRVVEGAVIRSATAAVSTTGVVTTTPSPFAFDMTPP